MHNEAKNVYVSTFTTNQMLLPKEPFIVGGG